MQDRNHLVIVSTALLAVLPACAQMPVEEASTQTDGLAYPATRMSDQVDVYHGVEVQDPYRWLEDDVRENPEVAEWVEAQNAVTLSYLAGLPARERIDRRLTELWDYEKFGTPFKEGGRYFYSYNDGLQNQNVVYALEKLEEDPQLLLDPNTWSDDGTVALAGYVPSPDGRYVAYLVQDGGSDWRTARVMKIAGRKTLDDELSWLKFTGLTWASDSSGFYYSRYPAPAEGQEFQALNKNQAVYFHRIGTAQSEDEVVYARPDHPEWGYGSSVTDDGRYLVITVWFGTDNRYQIVYQDLADASSKPVMLIEGFDNDYTLVGNVGSELIFRTDFEAPQGRIIAIDVENPARANWREIVAESANVLEGAAHIGGRLVASYLKDARSEVLIFGLDGNRLGAIETPGIGRVDGLSGKPTDSETFFSYSSFNAPPTIYRYDVGSGARSVFRAANVDFNPADYVVKQQFYKSKDGTRVPMFIAHRRDIELNGEQPTLLYGYGGFNISQRPGFSITRLAWMEMGGVYAVANIRGGGEYGEPWHEAGTKLKKQNVFDDFIAAAEYLIEAGYTRPDKLAVFGGSNGGLLVGAVVNQRPDLFAAAIPAVGVMDMLRFHQFTAGRFWVDDYGSADNPDEFAALYAYSPYHNLKAGTDYPAVMVTTADTDDRVVPGHSFKYAAALQAAHSGSDPVLIRIETRAGHGAGVPTDKIIQSYADRWAFLADNLGMSLPDGY